MQKATSIVELLSSHNVNGDGKFTLDASHFTVLRLNFSWMNLTSLEGCPKTVITHFIVNHTQIQTLDGCPELVCGDFDCSHNHITNLCNIHKNIPSIGKSFVCFNNKITHSILGVCLIQNLKIAKFSYLSKYSDNNDAIVDRIINKYLYNGDKIKLYRCAQELVKAGYPELAKL